MGEKKRRAQRVVAGAALALAATATMSATTATAAPRSPLTDCFVTTVNVPAYEVPNGRIVVWVGQGQGLFLTRIEGPWRQGNLWGGPSGVWIHSNYLRC